RSRRLQDEFVESRRIEEQRIAFDARQSARGVCGFSNILLCGLLQSPTPQCRQVDCGHKHEQTFIGADIRTRLLAPYMLLASGERYDETAIAVVIECLPDQPAGHLPLILRAACEDPQVRTSETRRNAEGLAFAHYNVRA